MPKSGLPVHVSSLGFDGINDRDRWVMSNGSAISPVSDSLVSAARAGCDVPSASTKLAGCVLSWLHGGATTDDAGMNPRSALSTVRCGTGGRAGLAPGGNVESWVRHERGGERLHCDGPAQDVVVWPPHLRHSAEADASAQREAIMQRQTVGNSDMANRVSVPARTRSSERPARCVG
jgi:hypothetical protein